MCRRDLRAKGDPDRTGSMQDQVGVKPPSGNGEMNSPVDTDDNTAGGGRLGPHQSHSATVSIEPWHCLWFHQALGQADLGTVGTHARINGSNSWTVADTNASPRSGAFSCTLSWMQLSGAALHLNVHSRTVPKPADTPRPVTRGTEHGQTRLGHACAHSRLGLKTSSGASPATPDIDLVGA